MRNFIKNITDSISHLLFPHNCLGCSTDILNDDDLLCVKCAYQMPTTKYFNAPDNPVDRTFYGRLRIENAAAGFYYTKESLVQHLMVQLKYKGNKEVGFYLGRLIGYELQKANRYKDVEALIPLPLNVKREFKRGYNQSMEICKGITSVWHKPIISDAVIRTVNNDTQTHENRENRWLNVDGIFLVSNPDAIIGKHVLLVDDVVTTGATIESCGSIILKVPNTKLSVACVATVS